MTDNPLPNRPVAIDPAVIDLAMQRARYERSEAARALFRTAYRRLARLVGGLKRTADARDVGCDAPRAA
jgi:hypothetical protein